MLLRFAQAQQVVHALRSWRRERGVDDKTIRRRIADGSLIAYRLGPRLIRLDRESVLNYGPRTGGVVAECRSGRAWHAIQVGSPLPKVADL